MQPHGILSALITASMALTSFLTQLQHTSVKQLPPVITPSVVASTPSELPTVISTVKSWKTISDQYISFNYPADWTLERSSNSFGEVYSIKQPTYPFTKGLPFFSVSVADKTKFDSQTHISSTLTNFLDIYAPYHTITIDTLPAKRARLDLSHGRWIQGEDVALYVPKKNIYVKMGMQDVGINFDQQINNWFNPVVASIKL